jgi:hypothetical protein
MIGLLAAAVIGTAQPAKIPDIIGNYEYTQVVNDGYTGPAFDYTLCNLPAATQNEAPCSPGQVPIFNSAATLDTWLAAGHDSPASDYALLDMEPGTGTPTYELDRMKAYVCKAASDAKAAGVKLISAVVTPRVSATVLPGLAVDVEAAKCGAFAAELQIQGQVGNPKYKEIFLSYYRAIERAVPGERVITGLGTDAQGAPRTVRQNYDAWESVRAYASGFWLNIAFWAGHPGCAPEGCVPVAVGFLKKIEGTSQ